MKARISVSSIGDFEKEAGDAVKVYEDAPKGANPEDGADPYFGENGTLVVKTEELEVEADFPLEEFPQQMCFPVYFVGWEERAKRTFDANGLQIHFPADVKITLKRKWLSESNKSMALYCVTADHRA